jgi:ligand-binding sensor domain-containing protein
MKGIFGLLLLLFFGQTILLAQQWPERFKHFSIDDGLTANNVTAIQEDAFGFIWVGTEEGLNRFDGSNFKHFFASDQPGALAGNYVMDLLHLGAGKMLIALASDGLQVYDPANETFASIAHPLAENQLPYANARALIFESDSTVLAAYWKGPKSSGGLVRFKLRDFSYEILYPKRILQLYALSHGINNEIWLSGDSLYCLNFNEEPGITHFESPFRLTKNVPYYAGVLADDHEVLVGSRGEGVHVLDRKTRLFTEKHVYQEEGVSMVFNQAMKLMPYPGKAKTYWVVTRDKGVAVWDRLAGVFHFIDTREKWSITRGEIMGRCGFIDHRGIVWFGSNSGLFMHSVDNYQIGYKDYSEALGVENEYSTIARIAPMNNQLFVSVARAKGSLRLNANTLKFEAYAPDEGLTIEGIEYRIDITSLRLTADGKIRASGYNRYYEFDPESNNWKILLDLSPEIDLISKYSGLVTAEESSNQRYWWFGTIDNWLARYDRASGTLKTWWLDGEGEQRKKVISPDGKLGVANRIYSIAPDNEDGAYVASYNGVFHVTDHAIRPMKDDCADCGFFERNTYGRIQRDGDRLIFATTAEGVYSYGLADQSVRQYNRENGLPSLHIADFAIDPNGRIWGVSPGGLFSIDEKASTNVRSFSEEDGLFYRDLSYHFISILPDGRAMVGMHYGIAWFDPDALRSQPSPERTILHEVRINGAVIIPKNNTITLQYGDGLEVAFSGLGFIQPERFAYSWRIPGRTDWQTVERPRVFFPSWRENDFVLELRVGDQDGNWLDDTVQLYIEVDTPFIHTDAFWWVLAFLFVALIYGLYRYRYIQLRKQALIRTEYGQRLAEIEMQALRAQMNPHFLFNSLNSIKYFIIRNQTDLAADYLTKFSRLIRLILSNSKQERVSLATELEALRLYVELEGLRFDQKFEFELVVDQNIDPEEIQLPPLLIQPFAENAIWHGLMHKTGAGKLAIRLSLKGNELVCEIEDNGIGREKAAEMRSKSATRDKSLGIDITRNRLERMNLLQSPDRMIEVIDLYLPNGAACGTLVRLSIPVQF